MKNKDINTVFLGGDSLPKKTRYLRWVRDNFPGLSPSTPGLRERFDAVYAWKQNELNRLVEDSRKERLRARDKIRSRSKL